MLTIVLAPLIAAVIAGLAGRVIGRVGAHCVTIAGVALSFGLSAWVLKLLLVDGAPNVNESVYTWLVSDGMHMEVGFLVDRLTALMMVVVTFVSLCVHVYTIGYMHDDPGYQRFFSYISLFTFSMLMLVMSNNFLQLFFGWEAVGLVSYLLIGFWYTRPSAIFANLKAFLVNRVGDFGFVLGIAGVAYYTGSLDYATVFGQREAIAANTMQIIPGVEWQAMTVICICLFIGAMGKSAQVPLHVWLPDSMEGPTPISALIHAATMVTAGIFMVARMSPLFELSETALSTVLIIGATTAFFMGLLGLVNNDIKRVIAYSTLSQLGYMTVALGVSAYGAAIFHLMTHAFFKALLFLAAGSVIIAMHHEQDMRKMGGLKKYLPITYWTSLIGTLALIGFPGTSGFFSKDALIEAVHASHDSRRDIRVLVRVSRRVRDGVLQLPSRLHDFPWAGAILRRWPSPMLNGEDTHMSCTDARTRGHEPRSLITEHDHGVRRTKSPWVVTAAADPAGDSVAADRLVHDRPGSVRRLLSAMRFRAAAARCARPCRRGVPRARRIRGARDDQQPPVWSGAARRVARLVPLHQASGSARRRSPSGSPLLYRLLANKFYFDEINQAVFAGGSRGLGMRSGASAMSALIDGALVNGSARIVGWFSGVMRRMQSGYLYHYAFAMIIGLSALLGWYVLR